MKSSNRHYWAEDAVMSLFIRDQHTDDLLGLLECRGPIYTNSVTVAAIRLGVLKAAAEHRLRPKGAEEIRRVLADSVQRGFIVLVDAPTPSSVETLPVVARPHIMGLSTQQFQHLSAALGGGFRYFVTINKTLVAASRDWGFTVPHHGKLPASISFKSRLDRCRHLASELVSLSDELKSEVDTLLQDKLTGENEELDDACRNFADEVDVDFSSLESLIFDIEDALTIDSDDPQNGT